MTEEIEFEIGQKVEKAVGDYDFSGTVIGKPKKLSGQIRYDIEDEKGSIHIFSGKQLRASSSMKPYIDLVRDVMKNGVDRPDRTGTGSRSVFGRQIRFDLSKGFPLLTEKKTHWKSVVHELIWFLSGDTNIKYLKDNGVKIWDQWRASYNLNRNIVKVTPRIKAAQSYDGDFSWSGIDSKEDSEERMLAQIWLGMMRRCYDPKHDRYNSYGAKDRVTVAKEWHDVNRFIEDAKKLPHWEYKKADPKHFDLDKDYYSSNQYGPDTCVWLREDENILYTSSVYPIKVTKPDGWSKVYLSASIVAKEYNISTSSLNRFINEGMPKTLKQGNKGFEGWSFEKYSGEDFNKLRLELIEDGELGPIYSKQWRSFNGFDQIANVIESIQNNPDSRRHIVSAWNPTQVDDMALPPCHTMFQFYVADGKLSCQLYQRSADLLLGVPFNIASYALLTHMIAHVTGLEVGDFVHTFGDVHLYHNHFDQAKEMIERSSFPLPTIELNASVTKIDDFKFEDIRLVNYQSHPAIKAPVAV